LAKGKAAAAKYHQFSVRTSRWHLVCPTAKDSPAWELHDVERDQGEANDVAAREPEVVRELSASYDKWWESVQASLVNEDAVGPAENPFKTLYRRQFGE
jgi:hypothetical protein